MVMVQHIQVQFTDGVSLGRFLSLSDILTVFEWTCRGGHEVLANPLLSSFIHAVAVFVLMGYLAPSQQRDTRTHLMELLSHIDFS